MCPSPPIAWHRQPALRLAVAITVLLHGSQLIRGSYRDTYDAYVHLFFADHYARGWFDSWEPRWYTGFSVTSYPPGTHQLLALWSQLTDFEWAFVILQLAAMLGVVTGIYRFGALWVDERAAAIGSVAASLSSSLAEVVHVFGQLPTTAALALLLHAQPSIRRWIVDGRSTDLVAAFALMAATTACHHVTTLFGSVFFTGPVVARAIFDVLRRSHPAERIGHPHTVDFATFRALVARRLLRATRPLLRTAVFGVGVLGLLAVVVLPYWIWSSSDPIVQVSIPHASRENFLVDRAAGLIFWVVPWASVLLVVPFAWRRAVLSRAWPLGASISLLALLGTGGTTPLPRLMLGGAFDILTLDRFTIWATIAILPFVGAVVAHLIGPEAGGRLRDHFGRYARGAAVLTIAAAAAGTVLATIGLSEFRPLQPDPIDPDPIVEFIAKDNHDDWRYLTLGFGDQMAWVSAQTDALTVDGNYHSARRLPELTSRSVERLEGAKFQGVPGIGSLQQFLTNTERYHLKFVFSVDEFYDPLLFANGWERLDRLRNGVVVWEKPDVSPLPRWLPIREIPGWQRLMWGTLPMTAIVAAAFALLWIAFGRPGQRPARANPATGVIASLEYRLAVVQDRLPDTGEKQRWLRLPQRSLDPISKRRRRLQQAALALTGCVVVGVGALIVGPTSPKSPEEIVFDYYDHLDFARPADAWRLLDPTTRPTYDAYLQAISVEDGLLRGYGKLDAIEIIDSSIDGHRAEVEVELTTLTALDRQVRRERHRLALVDGRWALAPPEFDPTVPPQPHLRRAEVGYLSQGRRQVDAVAGSGSTNYHDVLDRPTLEIAPSRLVEHDDRLWLVGEVTNTDVDPAHVTVEVAVLDSGGDEVLVVESGAFSMHRAGPGETIPFRVEVVDPDAVSVGGGDGSPMPFDPTLSDVPLDADIAEVIVGVRALVSEHGGTSPLQAESLAFVESPARLTVAGRVRNDGLVAATVPHAMVTLYDDSGEVAWIADAWLPTHIRPQRTGELTIDVVAASELDVIDVPITLLANGVSAPTRSPGGTLPLDGGSGYAALRIDFDAFSRDAS